MKTRLASRALPAAALLGGLLLASGAQADEGLWLYNRFPFERLLKAHGFKPDQAWLDRARLASVRLEGSASGSFVSSEGLVMTNHHCAEECINNLSTPKSDLMVKGFAAKNQAAERRCPNTAVDILLDIREVTERVQKARVGKSDKDGNEAVKAEIATLEKECQKTAELRCEVVKLYNGGIYDLYTYRRHDDVRLVFAPEFRIAFFGGDPDNFEFPRYDLDMAFLRVYQDDKPLATPNYMRFAAEGTKAGDLTFISGHPASTSRQLTVAQIESWRDDALIPRLMYLSEYRGLLLEYAHRGKEQARHSREELFGVENSLKAFRGELDTLIEPAVLNQKRAEEKAMRDYVAADKGRQATYGKAWDAIADAMKIRHAIYQRYNLVERGRGYRSALLDFARTLVRATAELPKANEKRLREFTEGEWSETKQGLLSEAPTYLEFETFRLGWSLTKLREVLGPDEPYVKTILGAESPQQLATRVIKGTKLADPKVRAKLLEGGAAAVAASKDPLIELARKIDPEARAIRQRYEDEVDAVVGRNHELLAKVRFEQFGTSVYPDATFTLRLSYGTVEGYMENGRRVEPYTTFGGAFARHTGADPFMLPPSWMAKKDQIDPNVPFNFATSNDILGGNSGSPVFNKAGEIVGLVFDGNIQSLGGDYGFDASMNRAVALDARAIVYALEKIYAADALVKELGGK